MPVREVEEEQGDALLEGGDALRGEEELDGAGVARAGGGGGGGGGLLLGVLGLRLGGWGLASSWCACCWGGGCCWGLLLGLGLGLLGLGVGEGLGGRGG